MDQVGSGPLTIVAPQLPLAKKRTQGHAGGPDTPVPLVARLTVPGAGDKRLLPLDTSLLSAGSCHPEQAMLRG